MLQFNFIVLPSLFELEDMKCLKITFFNINCCNKLSMFENQSIQEF